MHVLLRSQRILGVYKTWSPDQSYFPCTHGTDESKFHHMLLIYVSFIEYAAIERQLLRHRFAACSLNIQLQAQCKTPQSLMQLQVFATDLSMSRLIILYQLNELKSMGEWLQSTNLEVHFDILPWNLCNRIDRTHECLQDRQELHPL